MAYTPRGNTVPEITQREHTEVSNVPAKRVVNIDSQGNVIDDGSVDPNNLLSQQLFLEINRGNVTGASISIVEIEGTIASGSIKDVWGLSGEVDNYTFSTTKGTWYASSSDASDTSLLLVRGLGEDTDGSWVIQSGIVTLSGQSQVAISAALPWIRFWDTINIGTSDFAGTVYIAETDTLTAGKPDTLTKIRGVGVPIAQRSLDGVFSCPTGKRASFIYIDSNTGKGQNAYARYGISNGGGRSFVRSKRTSIYEEVTREPFDFAAGIGADGDFVFTVQTDNSSADVSGRILIVLSDLT